MWSLRGREAVRSVLESEGATSFLQVSIEILTAARIGDRIFVSRGRRPGSYSEDDIYETDQEKMLVSTR